MIEYSPNRSWFRDVVHLGTSWTLQRLVRAALLIGAYSLVLSFIILRLDLEGHRSISGTFSLLGVILSIILVFRTNTAYDRWWEGRKQWGTLVNHSRNLAIQLDVVLPADDREARSAYAGLIADFALALSKQLRGEVLGSPTSLPVIQPAELGSDGPPATAAPGRLPMTIAHEILARVHAARRDGEVDGMDLLLLKPHTQALLDVAGACERIRKTPIPFSYSVFIKVFILLYAAILPVGLVPEYGYLAVPLTMLVVFALLGLELMAEEIEDPFGTDCNDLPTGTIAAMIRSNVAALLEVEGPKAAPAPQPYSKTF